MEINTLAILGLGLLGGSLGLAAKQRGLATRVVGWSHREITRLGAIDRNAIDEGQPTPQDAVADADLVVVCTPVGVMAKLFETIGPALKPGAIVTDVGSTKNSLVIAGERFIHSPAHFVGSHPVAGAEKQGIDAARAELFDNALCILTPTQHTDAAALKTVDTFWQSLTMRTTRLSPVEHDHILSDVSHLPHLVAAAMMLMQEERGLKLAGSGLRDTTRIAAGDAGLWRDIFVDNRSALIRSLDRVLAHLRDFRTALQAGDSAKIEALLKVAAEKRRGM
ncbi:MAG: prephenate dehydrogenase/arogenate dehydrogenase family protein [Tepidisphaeraceae bacterium]